LQGTLMPPGTTTTVTAPSALVIAPHFDDDVLGCGGLIAQLADAGAEVTVLFLTDGSGGVEEVEDRPAYAERRHAEARAALEILGVHDIIFVDLPDGSVAEHLDEAAEAIRAALLEKRPRLLLTISPLEISPDHRATFAAVHEVLAPLRGGTELDETIRDLDILLYEANHPAFPDVLVDVSGEIDRIRRAIEAHESQLERHNYREMTIGLRSLRTASLPIEVTAAEGFRRLTPNDFATHSRADLIRRLGGVAELHEVQDGPKISVIVRTKDRPKLLAEALASLAAGSYRRVEVVLVNDGGDPPEVDAGYPLEVVRVDLPENRGRAAAANSGIEAATGHWIAFLDDDDLAAPEHLATLAGLTEAAGTRVVYTDAAVGVYEIDPELGWREVERRLPYSRDFDPELLLFDNYIPFNTLLIEHEALREAGPLDPELPFFEDWDLLIRLAAITPFHHFARVTAEYRHFRGGSHVLGEHPKDRVDFLEMKARVIERHRDRHTSELLARVVDRLRGETVAAIEGYSDHSSTSAGVLHSRTELLEELERHRSMLAERDETLQNLYLEIQRLNGVIREMQGTKVWKIHDLIEKVRGR
jgi:LmbE family N-acetylglucosaminyl deacetylase